MLRPAFFEVDVLLTGLFLKEDKQIGSAFTSLTVILIGSSLNQRKFSFHTNSFVGCVGLRDLLINEPTNKRERPYSKKLSLNPRSYPSREYLLSFPYRPFPNRLPSR